MAIKTIPIREEETLELYHKAKVKYVNNNYPKKKITDEEVIKTILKKYIEE